MTNLADMNARMNAWMSEKPQFDGGLELRLNEYDIALLNFVANGDEGDRFIKVYRSHVFATTTKSGKPNSVHRYCPVQSGEAGVECPFCAQGHDVIKERMSMYFWITSILHAQLPKDKSFPLVQYGSRQYFHEEVNGYKVWHTSAWKESPWGDIVKLNDIYHGLHNFTAELTTVGQMIAKRFKLYALPNTAGLPPEIYQRAMAGECEPLLDVLHKELSSPVAVNPTAAATQAAPVLGAAQPFTPPGQSVQLFQPVTTTPAPAAAAPALVAPAPAAAPTPTLVAPVAAPAPPTVTPAEQQPQVIIPQGDNAQEPIPVAEQPLVAPGPSLVPAAAPVVQPPPETASTPEGESRRPMRSLF